MENKKKAFVSFLDDNDKVISGFFDIVEFNSNYVKLRSGRNIITLSWLRIKKIKQEVTE